MHMCSSLGGVWRFCQALLFCCGKTALLLASVRACLDQYMICALWTDHAPFIYKSTTCIAPNNQPSFFATKRSLLRRDMGDGPVTTRPSWQQGITAKITHGTGIGLRVGWTRGRNAGTEQRREIWLLRLCSKMAGRRVGSKEKEKNNGEGTGDEINSTRVLKKTSHHGTTTKPRSDWFFARSRKQDSPVSANRKACIHDASRYARRAL